MAAEGQPVRLNTWQWISLIVLVAGAGWSIHYRIDALDDRWQERAMQLTRELRLEHRMAIESLEIPPPLFKQQVDRNTEAIDRLEREFTRDFVRKDELPRLLEHHHDKK